MDEFEGSGKTRRPRTDDQRFTQVWLLNMNGVGLERNTFHGKRRKRPTSGFLGRRYFYGESVIHTATGVPSNTKSRAVSMSEADSRVSLKMLRNVLPASCSGRPTEVPLQSG